MEDSLYCGYYQAHVTGDCGFLVAIFRGFEHLAFDRTIDKVTSIFEFYVPPLNEPIFVQLMDHFLKTNVISSYEKKENRLKAPQSVL